RVGHVPNLVALAPESTQQIDLVGIALAQAPAVAHARHLRGAGLAVADRARNMREIFRLLGIGDIYDRGAVELALAVERIDRLGERAGAAVMADIGDVMAALL